MSDGPSGHGSIPSMYLGRSNYPALLTDPSVSPLFGDFQGLPPLLIHSGSAECLRDDHTLLAALARRAGVAVTHEILVGGIHVMHNFALTPVAQRALRSIGDWCEQLEQPKDGLPTAATATLARALAPKWTAHQARLHARGLTPIKVMDTMEAFMRVLGARWEVDAVCRPPPRVELRTDRPAHAAVQRLVTEEVRTEGGQRGDVVWWTARKVAAREGVWGWVAEKVRL